MVKTMVASETDAERTKYDLLKQEYQDFSYIVSHDLNAPLRHVKEFTRLLINAHRDGDIQDASEYAGMLEKCLLKMDQMQSALLSFSRVNSVPFNKEKIDPRQSIELAIDTLEGVFLEYNPAITFDNMPLVNADRKQLGEVFTHLLDNAIKFHEASSRRAIKIICNSDERNHIFSITDNGIGIDEQFQTQVFKMFRRLNAPDKYSGIGSGLTIAQKIIQKHGGDMWLQSNECGGITVYFNLPIIP